MPIRWLPLALALVVGGCNSFQDIQNGEPALPGPVMLTPDAQSLVQAANAPLPPGAMPPIPRTCAAVIKFEDSYPVTPGVQAQDNAKDQVPAVVNINNYTTLRNNCISDYIQVIDNQYREYRIELVHLTGGGTAIADTLTGVLSAAASGVGGSTARILSGITAAIAAGKQAINTDVLYNNSVLAVIAQMDADRNEQYSIILQQENGTSSSGDAGQSGTGTQTSSTAPKYTIVSGTITKKITVQYPASGGTPARQVKIDGTETFVKPAAPAKPDSNKPTPLPAYTMHKAAVDLATYYADGTFSHALVSLQQQSGTKATNCKTQVNSIKTTGSKTGASTTADPTIDASPSGVAPASSSNTSTPSGC